MSFPTSASQLPSLPHVPRWVRIALVVIVGLIVLGVLFNVFVVQYTNLLWFDSVHYSSVWRREVVVQVVMFLVTAFAMAVWVLANVVIAYRSRPRIPTRRVDDEAADGERPSAPRAGGFTPPPGWSRLARPARVAALVVVGLVVGIPAGAAAAKRWQLWMLWSNRTPFGVKDPQFHRDVSYFAFTYPLERFVLSELFAAAALAIAAVLVTSYLFGSLRPNNGRLYSTPAARAHLAVLLGVFVLLKAAAYWLDRYGLAFSTQGNVTGLSYTDVHATLPAKTILVFIAVICALLFFANLRLRNWRLPILAFGLMAVSAIVIGGVYPALVQALKVKPSQQDLEAPYIQRNINATRQAFGITNAQVKTTNYPGTTTASPKTLRSDVNTDAQLRLLDPNVVTQTFNQLQQDRSFYSFSQPLDIDRYQLGGDPTPQDVVIGTRNLSLSGVQSSQQNWINQHLIYTHGYGVVAALAEQLGSQGNPDFIESNLPPKGQLTITQPRVYFGVGEPSYSIVGAPPGGPKRELDLPSDNSEGQQNFTYNGGGGVPVGSLWRRILYAWKLGDKNVLLSSEINSASHILYVRDPRSRVHKVAPWLTLDSNPYPVVADGSIDWVVDGYTTTNGYPYSEQESLASDTSVTTSTGESANAQGSDTVNYIRNSVKAVVNAYTGQVSLYEWDPSGQPDAVLHTWMKAFPGVVQPESAIPAALLPHLRYPEDLFNIQRSLIARYHVTDPKAFYNGTDFWTVPGDPTVNEVVSQPSYYLTMSQDGTSTPVFALTTTLTSLNRRNLTAYLSVDADPGPDYGHFQLLQLPANQIALAPGQVQNDIESDPTISHNLTLLRGGGSRVVRGNLVTVPIDGSLLYIEPIYVQAAGGQSFPELRRVIADFQGQLGYAPTLAQALDQALGTPSAPSQPSNPSQPSKPSGPSKPSHPAKASAALRSALARAAAAETQAQADLRAGNFAAYGRDEQRLASALAAARRAAG